MKDKNTTKNKTSKTSLKDTPKQKAKQKIQKRTNKKSTKNTTLSQFINTLFISIVVLSLLVLGFLGITKYILPLLTEEKTKQAIVQKSLEELTAQKKITNNASQLSNNQTEKDDNIENWLKRIDSAINASIKSSNITQNEFKTLPPTKIKIFNLNYLCKNIELNLNIESADFILNLKNNLELFAQGALLSQVNEKHWQVSVYNIITHNLYINQAYSFNEFEEGEETPDTIKLTLDELMANINKGKTGCLAIVIDDLGNSVQDMQALTTLNYPVTVAIWPHGIQKNESAKLAKQKGLDILVHLPMEPLRSSEFKPGPNALYYGMNKEKIDTILELNLKSVPYAIGLNNHMGSRFTQWKDGIKEVVNTAKQEHFLILDSVTHPNSILFKEAIAQGVPAYQRQIFLDNKASVNYILKQLELAEKVALHQGEAIAIGHPKPETLEALKIWETRKDPNVELVLLHNVKSH